MPRTHSRTLLATSVVGLVVGAAAGLLLTANPPAAQAQQARPTLQGLQDQITAMQNTINTQAYAANRISGTVAYTNLPNPLDADLLDGLPASSFLSIPNGDARYLGLSGGTVTGTVTVSGSNNLHVGGRIGVGTATPGFNLDVTSGTGSIGTLSVGSLTANGPIRVGVTSTAGQPAAPTMGMILFNTDLGKLRVYSGAGWQTVTSN